jgi:hypothetical protein
MVCKIAKFIVQSTPYISIPMFGERVKQKGAEPLGPDLWGVQLD